MHQFVVIGGGIAGLTAAMLVDAAVSSALKAAQLMLKAEEVAA
jgi:succinate dehydrogenase/fumarate reductase flavoprotein subunit